MDGLKERGKEGQTDGGKKCRMGGRKMDTLKDGGKRNERKNHVKNNKGWGEKKGN